MYKLYYMLSYGKITPGLSSCIYLQAAFQLSVVYGPKGVPMQNEWLFIGIFLVLAPVFPGLALIIPRLVAPRKPNKSKLETYECGIETVGSTWVQFRVQYYVFALVFLIFDVETVFLYPWAVAFNQLSLFAVLEGVLFILILAAGLIYAWRKGVLEWI
jgi:NADH:ubiquinone oxidoreductase subunit 3 (subunit A)